MTANLSIRELIVAVERLVFARKKTCGDHLKFIVEPQRPLPGVCKLYARLPRTLSQRSWGSPTQRRTSLTIQPASVSLDRRAGSRQYVST
jgi:hypothetical protein